jgi:hypothetical protein
LNGVPNVPCGVESSPFDCFSDVFLLFPVPNVPCGVERILSRRKKLRQGLVPNVPCGVERHIQAKSIAEINLFLMYRVELKGRLLKKGYVVAVVDSS